MLKLIYIFGQTVVAMAVATCKNLYHYVLSLNFTLM